MQVTVSVPDKIVAVDGVPLLCDFKVDPSIAAIRWFGEALYGTITPAGDTAGGGDFRDPAVIAPYVAAWRATMARRLNDVAAAAAGEADAFAKFQADAASRQKALTAAAAKKK